ncbi:hypothetical protein M3Y98_00534200 [Aphelenchoides besseyi]|nr:hypothetical protein M3Y98_00534200 [Aphelenchoides besseyi]KAI6208075.1 hypothetical protein M3Y96_00076100 [Aphelenchoides besseyi]
MSNLDAAVTAIANFLLNDPINEGVYEQLDGLFEQLIRLAQNHFADPTRSVCLSDVAPFAHCVFRHVLRLHQRLQDPGENEVDMHASASEAQHALAKLLRLSFDDECRKVQVSLGLVSTIAEWLVVDLAVFGFQQHKITKETRRAIGNCLTNLTYGNVFAKKTLCAHDGFLRDVTRLIDSNPESVQSYGALIRNLSWNADTTMIQALSQTVPSLARTVVRLHNTQGLLVRKDLMDDGKCKCLFATVSGLWNLSSHSMENKRAMCETPEFLIRLISNLSNEPDKILLVENYSGVLKYLAGYIADREDLLHLVHEVKIVRHLLGLLNSSSFTVILNALGALGPLSAKDTRTQLKLIHSEPARLILDSLRNSVREDVRNAVKIVLTNLNSSPLAGYSMSMPSGNMSSRSAYSTGRRGMRLSSERNDLACVTSNQRLLPQRQGWQYYIQSPDDERRQSTDSYFGTFPYSRRNGPSVDRTKNTRESPTPLEMDSSALATGLGSLQSLSAEIPSGWQSNITTARNSGIQSPFSPSNLPDSPSDLFIDKLDGNTFENSNILADAIESVMPKPRATKTEPSTNDDCTILDECIARVLPKPRRRDMLETSTLLQNTSTLEKVRDVSELNSIPQNNEDHFEDNYCIGDLTNDLIDVSLPKDVDDEFEAEHLEIDCTETARSSSTSRIPASNRLSNDYSKSTMRSVRVSPFNYKHPTSIESAANVSSSDEKNMKTSLANTKISNFSKMPKDMIYAQYFILNKSLLNQYQIVTYRIDR